MIDSPVRRLILMISVGFVLIFVAEIFFLAIQIEACSTFCLIHLDRLIVCTLVTVYEDVCPFIYFLAMNGRCMHVCMYV